MNRGKKIVYTESAKERLEKLHFEVNKEIEYFLQEVKYIPGEDFIEVTALDIEEVSKRLKIVRSSNKHLASVVPTVYSVLGIILASTGLFYEAITTLVKDNPVRLTLILTGFVMIGISWIYLYLTMLRNRKETLYRHEDKLEKSNSVNNDGVIKVNMDRIIPDQRVVVHSAKYFFEKNYLNVTSKVKELVENNILEFTVNNDLMGGDPAHGKVKVLEIEYSIDGSMKKVSATEGSILSLI